MDYKIIQNAKELAITIIRQAGLITKEKFDNFVELRSKDEYGDVITEVDVLVEEIIIKQI